MAPQVSQVKRHLLAVIQEALEEVLCPLEVVEQLSRREVVEVNDLQEVEEEQPVLTVGEAACEAAEYLRCTYPPPRHGPRSCRCHSTGALAIL